MRRVVVTGLGMVTPLACGVEKTWQRLIAGHNAAATITHFDANHLPTNYACEIPFGNGSNATFNPSDWMHPKDRRKVDDFILYALAAAEQALEDARWKPKSRAEQYRSGVLVGSGIGGLDTISRTAMVFKKTGFRRLSPFFIPSSLINLASGHISIRYGLKGPNHSVVTACSTGAHAIGDAARSIMLDDADIMVAGGAENSVCEISIAGFNACKALSTRYRHDPKSASRPFSPVRDGFVIGEGAGIIVLEEYEHACRRGADIYAEIIGYGLSGDAYHITAPAPDGNGAGRCMAAAVKRAGINAVDIDYVNAHGTSTMADMIELKAVTRLLGDAAEKVTMSSTKSSIGHLLGAAGAVEVIFCILALRDQIAPPTLNLTEPPDDVKLDLAALKAVKRDINVTLSNSFGFGGTNASLIMSKVR